MTTESINIEQLKKSFQIGFFKRAAEYHFRPDEVGNNIAQITNDFFRARGFTDRQLGKEANWSELLNQAKDTLLPDTQDSLMDIANRAEPNLVNSNHKGLREVWEIAKHMGHGGINSGLAGAGIGAIGGALSAKEDESKFGKAGKGALLGGALGFGVGAAHDAYQLGDNSRSQLIDGLEKLKQHRPDQADNINQKIDAQKKSYWFEYFNPNHMNKKLSK